MNTSVLSTKGTKGDLSAHAWRFDAYALELRALIASGAAAALVNPQGVIRKSRKDLLTELPPEMAAALARLPMPPGSLLVGAFFVDGERLFCAVARVVADGDGIAVKEI